MKIKSLFITLCLAPLFSAVYAQKPFPKEHSIGFTGGIDMSKMSFSPVVPQDFKIGTTMGITWRYIEEKYFGIQAELLYTQRGWKDKLEDYPGLYYDRTLNYVELPVLSHIFFGNNRIRGFVNLGPKVAYYLGGKTNTNISNQISADMYEITHFNEDVSHRFDYGIIGGAGVELRFGKHSFLVEGRYYFGLGDIFPNEKKDVFESSNNQSIFVTATYLFHLTKKK